MSGRLIVVCLLVTAATGTSPTAQDSPEALGAAVIGAIQRRDETAVRALLDPESTRAVEELESGVVARNLASWMRREYSNSATVTAAAPADVMGFDPKQRAIVTERVILRFAAMPDAIVTIKQEDKRLNGSGPSRPSSARSGVRRGGARWYTAHWCASPKAEHPPANRQTSVTKYADQWAS